jgi:glucokinase
LTPVSEFHRLVAVGEPTTSEANNVVSPPTKPASTSQRILLEICRHDEISTRALARAVGLRPSTLEPKVRALQLKGLVEFRKGRRKVRLNPGFCYVVGIDLGASHLHFALGDFCGEILKDSTVKIRPEDGPGKMIAQMKEGIRRLAEGVHRGRLQGLAVGVPSPVVEGGVVTFANNLPGWRNINLGDELKKEFRVPVFMENDVNMAAIGEHWRGVARDVDSFVFIALGTGIGSGVFANGRLCRGRTGSAGEIHRMNIEWPRWQEDFGDAGYFESHASGQGIAAEGRKMLGATTGGDAGGLAEERDALFVFESWRQGSVQAQAVLEKIFTMLGVGIANVVAVLDPDLIVLGGGILKGAPEMLLSIVNKVVARIQPDPPPIQMSSLEDKAQTYGAIHSALTVTRQGIARRLR